MTVYHSNTPNDGYVGQNVWNTTNKDMQPEEVKSFKN
jgi:hypothetical protein